MTEIEIIKQAIEKITPGKWSYIAEVDRYNEKCPIGFGFVYVREENGSKTFVSGDIRRLGDLQFIANAPKWLAFLITIIESLQEKLDERQQENSYWRSEVDKLADERHDLIESLQKDVERKNNELTKAEQFNTGAWTIADGLANNLDEIEKDYREMEALIESQKEEIEAFVKDNFNLRHQLETLENAHVPCHKINKIGYDCCINYPSFIEYQQAEIAFWKEKELQACSKHHEYHSELDAKDALIESQKEEIKQALNNITKGKWELSSIHNYKGCAGKDCKQSVIVKGGANIATVFGAQYRATYNESPRTEINAPNAEFIANAPTWIASLITTIETKDEIIESLKIAKEHEIHNHAQSCLDYQSQIESQKEEIEQLQKPALYLAYMVLKQRRESDAESFVEHINGLESKIESLQKDNKKLALAIKNAYSALVRYEEDIGTRNHYATLHLKTAFNSLIRDQEGESHD